MLNRAGDWFRQAERDLAHAEDSRRGEWQSLDRRGRFWLTLAREAVWVYTAGAAT